MRRSPRSRLLTASVAAAAVLALAACGGDDDDDAAGTDPTTTTATEGSAGTADSTEPGGTASTGDGEVGAREEYVEAAAAQLQIEDDEFADCVAEAIVSDDVYAQIEERGVSVDGFSDTGPAGQGVTLDEDQAGAVAGDIAGCGDIVGLLLDGEELACAEEHLTNEQMAQNVAFTLFGVDPDEELQAAFTAMEECLATTATTTS